MTKLVNLDQLNVQTHRRVLWKDTYFDVRDFNVRDFIKFQGLQAEFGKAYQADDIASLLNIAKEITALAIPGFDPEELENMNPIQILSIVALIANLWPEEAPAEVQGEGAQGEVGNANPA